MPRFEETYSYLDEWKSLWEPDLEAIAFNGTNCDPTRVDPKVLQWAKYNCSHKPHFIKIVSRNAANGRPGLKTRLNNACQLAVPSPFVKEHFRELERVVTLENDEGKTWRVSFGDARTYPSWLQGWKRVAADNDLKPGEVMIFVLVANSRFHFTRFDEDGNILAEKGTQSTLNDIALGSRDNHSTEAECGTQPSVLGFDGHGHAAPTQQLAPAHKQIAEAPFKRRRLRKVGEVECKFKANSNDELNVAINNEHPL